MERNLCHENGCPDLCCIDRWNRFSPQEIADVFPKAIRLPWDEEVEWLSKGGYVLGEEGEDGRCWVSIRGRCPHNISGCSAPHNSIQENPDLIGDELNADMSSSLRGNPALSGRVGCHKPFICQNTPFAGAECNSFRKEKGLIPIRAALSLVLK